MQWRSAGTVQYYDHALSTSEAHELLHEAFVVELERAGHLLGIHKSLRMLFPHDLDLAHRWMTQPNRQLGARPVDLVIEHGFEGLLAVRRYLDFQRGQ